MGEEPQHASWEKVRRAAPCRGARARVEPDKPSAAAMGVKAYLKIAAKDVKNCSIPFPLP